MLSLPTKGGPIGLPEKSASIRMVLDKITDKADETNMCIPDVISAIGLGDSLEDPNSPVLVPCSDWRFSTTGPARMLQSS
jgi:hypothetical protein